MADLRVAQTGDLRALKWAEWMAPHLAERWAGKKAASSAHCWDVPKAASWADHLVEPKEHLRAEYWADQMAARSEQNLVGQTAA